MRLIASGSTPSINDVAAEAEVSRRTVYLYFPTFDQLLLDATVGLLSQASVDGALEDTRAQGIEQRVEAMVRALMSVSPEVERLGRALLRLTVDPGSAGGRGREIPRRGYRRVEWIEMAVAPLREKLGPVKFRRLVSGIAMVVGWEAVVVQRDVCNLTADEGRELSVWAARALVRAASSN